MTYFIRMSQKPNGTDEAEADWGGQTYRAESRHGANMALARVLCGAGAPDDAWVGVDARTGAKRLYGASLWGLSRWSVSETDQNGIKIVPWKPYAGPEAV